MNMPKRASFAVLAIIVVGLTGCYANVEPPEPAYSRMQELCAKNGGVRIYGPAVEVEGFFEEGGRGCDRFCQAEIRSGYAFIEAQADKADLRGYASQPGLYRFSRKPGLHPSCEAFYQKFRTPVEKRTADWPCIGAERIGSVTSKYRIGESYKREKVGIATFVTHHSWIDEIATGRRLAEAYGYSLHWEGMAVLPAKGDRYCPRTAESILPVSTILIPKPQ